MKKTKKGLTLVEVLVGITVFSIVIFALFTAVASMRKIVFRQEEYVKIKMVCYDIDAYIEKYKTDGVNKYFGDYYDNQKHIGYLTSKFEPISDGDTKAYEIKFNGNVIISITSIKDDRVFVENLDLDKIGNK